MAKTPGAKPSGKKPSGKKPAKPNPKPQQRKSGLDPYAVAYARLLADPCGAALVHPVYSGGNGGYLFRAESFAAAATGGTDTASFLHWTPGAVGSTGSQLLWGNAATATATPAAAAMTGATPGLSFLVNNASAYRCVAACIKISYVGAAATLQGRVHFGNTNGAYIDLGTTYGVNTVAVGLNHFSRTPVTPIELTWRPSTADEQWIDPASATAAVDKDRRGAITIAAADLPVGVGIFYHFTAVYEWLPNTVSGLQTSVNNINPSSNKLSEVVAGLDRAGDWTVRGMQTMGSMLRTAGAVGRAFGLIPNAGYMSQGGRIEL